MKKALLALSVFTVLSCTSGEQSDEVIEEVKDINVLVGTYTGRESQGIYQFSFNPVTGEASEAQFMAESDDPSFLALSEDQNFIYAVSEVNGGSIRAFSRTDTSMTFINEQSSGGVHPCHVAIDKTGKWVFAGNYTSGSLAVLPILENGGIGEPTQIIKHSGTGPNKERQEGPHVHSVNIAPDNKALFVPDLGIDKVKAYYFNDSTGVLSPGKDMEVLPGSGPRHFTFHPNGKYAYVLQELTGTVTSFSYLDGDLTRLEEYSTLPKGFEGKNSSADIHISADGEYLYASNRYHDSIVVFKIDTSNGTLEQVSHHSVLGQIPRNFAISPDGNFVLVANQESDNVVIFKRDTTNGKLEPLDKEVKVSMPVCLVFADN
ncbi:lactonase family protein [Jiulongibacter sp. NS-SX5]|uniref:lactonase family protein n=1 Tax=Jiulongibacter sp. NS-SX5 TaxID=3463854 RepID=UPI0040598D1E